MIDAAGYGKALFELASESGADTQVREELELIRAAFLQQPDYVTLLDTPALATEEKLRLLREAFGSMEPTVLNFISILCEKRSCYQFSACADVFNACYDEAHDLLRATAITAVPMQERQQEALKQKLSGITGKTVILTNRIDETLIGGMTLRYGGVQLDDSIRSRLDKLRRSLSDTIV
ncbi:MAG: ATP synthase F1 subunit delta [Oscillospiraceae bacterium]|nr:ATP synthase F1 subunit delta [Oscillospiraceae bacterium]